MKIANFKNIAYQNKTYDKQNKILLPNFKPSEVAIYPKSYYLPNFTSKKAIEFLKGKTLAQAKIFGYNLGITQYSGFDDNDLDLVNFINEGLTIAKNKLGRKIKIPPYIHCSDLGNTQMSLNHTIGGILNVNRAIYSPKKIADEVYRMIDELEKDGVLINNRKEFSINPIISNSKLNDFFKTINEVIIGDFDKLEYKDKIHVYNSIRNIYEKTSTFNRYPKELILKMMNANCWGEFDSKDMEIFEEKLSQAKQSKIFQTLFEFLKTRGDVDFKISTDVFDYKTLFHELGHMQDRKMCMLPVATEFNWLMSYTDEMLKWLDNKENLKTAFEVSPYACMGVPEFIAESYSLLLEGKELPQKALELYKKLGGPKVVLHHS